MDFTELALPGCYTIVPKVFADDRGRFAKMVVRSAFEAAGLRSDFAEQFSSESRPGVIRGMHFQLPPHDHAKLVYCAAGAVEDVLLDLRPGPTYGQAIRIELDAEVPAAVYIPVGIAHGFVARRAPALMVYNVTSEHSPAHDQGIRWDSFGFDWNVASPVISARDQGFVALADFRSPF